MVNILNEMYKNVEKMIEYEDDKGEVTENQKILDKALEEKIARKEELEAKIKNEDISESRSKLIEKDILENNADIQHIEARIEELAEQDKDKLDKIEISILRGKFQIESKYEQQLAEYDGEIQNLEAQIKEIEEQEKNSIKNVQEKIEAQIKEIEEQEKNYIKKAQEQLKQYIDVEPQGTQENIRKYSKEKIEEKINELDAYRENVKSHYEEQYAELHAKMQEVEEQKKNLYNFAEPIVERAKEIAAVVEQKGDKMETLRKLSEKGKAFEKQQEELQQKANQKENIVEQVDMQTHSLEPATPREQEESNAARNVLGAIGELNMPRANIQSAEDKKIADKAVKDAKLEKKEAYQKPEKIQEISDILIDVKMKKVYIAVDSEVDGEKRSVTVVDEIIFNKEEELNATTLIEENKIALLRKNIPDFDKVYSEVEQARASKQENEEALKKYHEYMEKFQDVDPIVIQTLDKMENVLVMEQYIEAVAHGKKDMMPFDLSYDLRNMKTTDFNLAQKQNIISYAQANKKIAYEARGINQAKRHVMMQAFEQRHPWYANLMKRFRGENEKTPELYAASTKTTSGEKTVPNSETIFENLKVNNKDNQVEQKAQEAIENNTIEMDKEEQNKGAEIEK